MKFKEFAKWCNERAADGFWSMDVAKYVYLYVRVYIVYHFGKEKKYGDKAKNLWLNV